MSARIREMRVILTEEISVDDCECILNAIQMISGVGRVDLVVSTGMESADISIAKMELKRELIKVVM